jgi:hypothetical protein
MLLAPELRIFKLTDVRTSRNFVVNSEITREHAAIPKGKEVRF